MHAEHGLSYFIETASNGKTSKTTYEKVPPSLLVKRGDAIVVDSFPGEQAMAFNVKGKGLVVLSSCAHAGIINTVKHVQNMTGIEKVYAVVGGFHLVNAPQTVIDSTVADMKIINPDFIVPAHCTGFEATIAFAKEMPGKFILNTAEQGIRSLHSSQSQERDAVICTTRREVAALQETGLRKAISDLTPCTKRLIGICFFVRFNLSSPARQSVTFPFSFRIGRNLS